jgi:hypothetical protein
MYHIEGEWWMEASMLSHKSRHVDGNPELIRMKWNRPEKGELKAMAQLFFASAPEFHFERIDDPQWTSVRIRTLVKDGTDSQEI